MSESRGEDVRSILAAAHLPGELVRFLNRGSYSLLIKGGPATGKTILALTLIKVLDVKRNYLYVSTRASPTQLFNNMRWLTEFLPKEDDSLRLCLRSHLDLHDGPRGEATLQYDGNLFIGDSGGRRPLRKGL